MINEARITEIAAALTAAGADWQSAAADLVEVLAVLPGNDVVRDRVDLYDEWAYAGGEGYPCRPIMVRTEDDGWMGIGWSDAALSLLARPSGVIWDPDADAGVHVDTTKDGQG